MVQGRFWGAWAGCIAATFVGGFVWHLLLFKQTYIELKIFTRIEDPVIPLGLSAVIIQGAILAYVYPLLSPRRNPAAEGLRFGALAGLFLATSAVLAEDWQLRRSDTGAVRQTGCVEGFFSRGGPR